MYTGERIGVDVLLTDLTDRVDYTRMQSEYFLESSHYERRRRAIHRILGPHMLHQ